jgi:hypothetical protein
VKEFGDFSRIIEFFKAEQRIFELLQTRSGEYAGSEQTKLLQNLVFGHWVLVAALRVEHSLTITLTVLQMNLNIDAVAPLVSERLELRTLNNFYFVGRVQHRVAANRFLRNLIDEEVAVVQQNGDAKWQIHLRRGHAVRFIGPTHVKLGGTGCSDTDLVHVFSTDLRVVAEDFFERIDGRMIAATAWVGFAPDVESLEAFSEILSQVRQIRIIAEGRAKAPVGGLEDIFDTGKTFGRKQCSINASLSGAAGMHPLYHGGMLRCHKAGGLGTGDT